MALSIHRMTKTTLRKIMSSHRMTKTACTRDLYVGDPDTRIARFASEEADCALRWLQERDNCADST